MDQWFFALIVFAAVLFGTGAVAWGQWLDHRRRMLALEVIKAAIEREKEPPAQVYAELTKSPAARAPWSEVVIFTALSVGFWVAYFHIGGESALRYLVVAATFTVTALGCLILAIIHPGGAKRTDAPR